MQSSGFCLTVAIKSSGSHQLVIKQLSSSGHNTFLSFIVQPIRLKLKAFSLFFLLPFQLFYLFYVAVGDSIQLKAAQELYNRGWRFNTSLQLWVARLPSVNPDVRHKTYEKGLYQYFNPSTWRRETKTMTLYYAELAMGNKH